MKEIKLRAIRTFALGICITIAFGFAFDGISLAKTAKEIDANVEASLERFHKEVKGAEEFLKSAKGVLVLPGVIKGGLVIGGEYGEGALRIDGKTVDYYSTASASYGFQLGGQKKDIILVFMQEEALNKFRESSGWKAGVDGSVALVKIGAAASLDTTKMKEPIVGFVFGQKGLMYNLTLEGSKFTKLKK
jgi:lipid-binding SYLF domain-containing protein